jgi:hypothetical protein
MERTSDSKAVFVKYSPGQVYRPECWESKYVEEFDSLEDLKSKLSTMLYDEEEICILLYPWRRCLEN